MQKSDGSVIFTTELDNKNLYRGLASIQKQIDRLNADIAKRESTINPLAEQLKDAQREAVEAYNAVERLRKELAETEAITGGQVSVPYAEFEAARERQEEIKKELAEQEKIEQRKSKTAEKLQVQYDKQLNTLESQREALSRLEELLAEQRTKIARVESIAPVAEAVAGAEKTFRRFLKTITNGLRRIFFFSLFYQGFRQIRNGMADIIKTNDQAVAAIARLKGAFLTFVQPVIETALPAFVTFINTLSTAVEWLAELNAALFGTTAKEAAKAAEALYEESSALEDVGKSGKKAEGSLASFDEINTINTEKQDDTIKPDFSAFDTNRFQSQFDKFKAMLSAGIALLVIGAVLAFSGVNVPLGITLMAIGAAMIYSAVALNWDQFGPEIQEAITGALVLLGMVALVVGAVLAFSGVNIPVGIALMSLGASALIAAAALNWDSMDDLLRESITAIMVLTGIIALVVGAVLAFSGVNVPVGIALMVLGASALIAAAALNWDSMGETLQKAVTGALVVVGVIALIIGCGLAFSGVNIPLGIALMAIGAAALITAAVLNWDKMGEELQSQITQALVVIGIIALVIGCILAFSGINIPLGIALMALGAVSLIAAAVLNWDSLGPEAREAITKVLVVVGVIALVLGAVLAFSGVNIPVGIALIALGAASLITAAALNWHQLGDVTREQIMTVLKYISYGLIVLGVILLFALPALWPAAFGMIGAGIGILAVTKQTPNWSALLSKFREMWSGIRNWWRTSVAKYFSVSYWKQKALEIVEAFTRGVQEKIRSAGAFLSNLFSGNASATVTVREESSGRLSSSDTFSAAASAYPTISREQVPALARGAVIPANREFLAVLGDQTNGRNLEAPESLLRQIQQEGNGEIVAVLLQIIALLRQGQTIQVDGVTLGRTVQKTLNDITAQSGSFALNW